MARRRGVLVVMIGAAAVAGCALGGRSVDVPPERGISTDIEATHGTTPPFLKHGQIQHDQPLDAFPWRLETGH